MMIDTQTLCSELFVRVEQLWGIPPELRMLSLGGHLLQPQTHLQSYQIENGTCIDLSAKGGSGETDSSTICNAKVERIINALYRHGGEVSNG